MTMFATQARDTDDGSIVAIDNVRRVD